MAPELATTDLSGLDFFLEEFDIDFEFDAPRFYDFSRPELEIETQEFDIWFELAGNYPPSPFSPKFNWKLEPLMPITNTILESKPMEITKPVKESADTGLNRKDKYNGFIYYNQNVKNGSKTKPKPKTKSSSSSSISTLTRPTASLLARQNKPLDIYSLQLLTRCQRSLSKFGDNLPTLLVPKQDTKKPKLEAKKTNVSRKPKLTVPKEPNLRTAERSERHKSKVNLETEQNAKSSSKRRITNKNISNTPKSTCLQAFRLRTSLRAKENDKEPGETTKIKCGTQSLCRTNMKPFLGINRSLDLYRSFGTQKATRSLIVA